MTEPNENNKRDKSTVKGTKTCAPTLDVPAAHVEKLFVWLFCRCVLVPSLSLVCSSRPFLGLRHLFRLFGIEIIEVLFVLLYSVVFIRQETEGGLLHADKCHNERHNLQRHTTNDRTTAKALSPGTASVFCSFSS